MDPAPKHPVDTEDLVVAWAAVYAEVSWGINDPICGPDCPPVF